MKHQSGLKATKAMEMIPPMSARDFPLRPQAFASSVSCMAGQIVVLHDIEDT